MSTRVTTVVGGGWEGGGTQDTGPCRLRGLRAPEEVDWEDEGAAKITVVIGGVHGSKCWEGGREIFGGEEVGTRTREARIGGALKSAQIGWQLFGVRAALCKDWGGGLVGLWATAARTWWGV